MIWGTDSKLARSGKPHIHAMHELLVCRSDAGTQWINRVPYPCRTGRVFLLPAGSFHGLTIEPGEDCRFTFLCFGETHFVNRGQADMHQLVKGLVDRDLFVYTPPTRDGLADALDQSRLAVQELHRGGAFAVDKANALLCLLLVDFYRGQVKEHEPATDNEQLKALCRRIAEDPGAAPSLPAAANAVYMSKSSFVQKFKYYTGTTYVDYILQSKIRIATDLFMKKDLSVTDVAGAAGFNNLGYFHRVFKKHLLMTPLAYKKFVKETGMYPSVVRPIRER